MRLVMLLMLLLTMLRDAVDAVVGAFAYGVDDAVGAVATVADDVHAVAVTDAVDGAGDADVDPAIKETAVTKLFTLWKPEISWGLETEPEPYCKDIKKPLIQGRVLGGGSTLNGRIFVRGHRRDFDSWAHLGNEGWSYDDVLPYFKKLEDFEGGASDKRGVGGPVHISKLKDPTPTALAWIEASKQQGYGGGTDYDYNSDEQG